MNVEGVKNGILSEVPGTGPPATPSQELNEEDFLNLLMTQLQHQDPLNPMEGTQMLEQISSLNQVEQLQAANANLEALILGMASLNNASAVQLIDRSVMVLGEEFEAEAGSVELGYVLDGAADSVQVHVYDDQDELVETVELGEGTAGLNQFTWSGAVPGESYRISVDASFEGEEVAAQTAISGRVTGLDFSEGFVKLVVGDLDVGLEQVLAVLPVGGVAGDAVAVLDDIVELLEEGPQPIPLNPFGGDDE